MARLESRTASHRHSWRLSCLAIGLFVCAASRDASALERLCDSSFENCRTEVLNLIAAETVEIDIGLWFLEDGRWSSAIIERWRAGVPVRVLMDTRANAEHPTNAALMNQLATAGVPMRRRVASGIEHWKTILLAGQNVVYFGGANFSPNAWVPVQQYVDYVDESIYGTDDPALVNSFKTAFDNAWVDTKSYANFANAASPHRHYPVYPIDPDLNFPPSQNFATRSVARYRAETRGIDVIIYRITDQRHTNAIIDAVKRGVPVRMIVEPEQYRDPSRLWHSWNVDRLYAAGVVLRSRAHEGLNHHKLTLLHGQQMAIFGSSNWTSPSAGSQHEHNYFSVKPRIYEWFVAQFERKWNNSNPVGAIETEPFQPLPPDRPASPAPATGAVAVTTSAVRLRWYGGPWAHVYDIYFGTSPNPPLFASGLNLGPSESAGDLQLFALPTLASGTTYYWRVVSRTMAQQSAAGSVWSFTTAGPAAETSSRGDFDGDRQADLALFRPSTGTWYLRHSSDGTVTGVQWGNASDRPVRGDYDGDGEADIAVFRPSNGTWYIHYSGSGGTAGFQWGNGGDIPTPGDYDGDLRTDIAVFRPSNGTWYVRYSGTGTAAGFQWGNGSDVPAPGDYDGDGKADLAVFRPSSGVWYVWYTRSNTAAGSQWGTSEDVPVPGDYDGDGRSDLAVFRPSTGTWYVVLSGTRKAIGVQWGNGQDVPVPADYDGDGRTDMGVFRPLNSTWYFRYATGATTGLQWGTSTDIPILKRP